MTRTRWVTQIRACGIVALFVGKHALQHKYLFAAVVYMIVKTGAGCVPHDAGGARGFVADPV